MEVVTDIELLNQVEAEPSEIAFVAEMGIELTKNPIYTLGNLQWIVNQFIQVKEFMALWTSSTPKAPIRRGSRRMPHTMPRPNTGHLDLQRLLMSKKSSILQPPLPIAFR